MQLNFNRFNRYDCYLGYPVLYLRKNLFINYPHINICCIYLNNQKSNKFYGEFFLSFVFISFSSPWGPWLSFVPYLGHFDAVVVSTFGHVQFKIHRITLMSRNGLVYPIYPLIHSTRSEKNNFCEISNRLVIVSLTASKKYQISSLKNISNSLASKRHRPFVPVRFEARLKLMLYKYSDTSLRNLVGFRGGYAFEISPI